MPERLGVIAGGGDLPARLVMAARAQGRDVFVLALETFAEPTLVQGVDHAWVRIGAVGEVIRLLRAANVREVVMAGKVKRPSVFGLGLDAMGAKFLARAGARALKGDDGLLAGIVEIFEEQGFRVVGADTVMAGLLAPDGPLGAMVPDEIARADIARGFEVAKALGALDVGQAVVVQHGVVLGVEAVEGTDALLARVGPLRRGDPGGVLVKAIKPKQERRVDLPTIGVMTLENCAAAGLRGVAIESGAAMIVDRAAVAAAADRLGLFVVGWTVTRDAAT